MPHFKFKAFDNAGRDHEGTLEAADAREAAAHLVAQGLKVRLLQEAAPAPQFQLGPAPAQPAPKQRPTPQAPAVRPFRPTPQAPSPQPPGPGAPAPSTKASVASSPVIRTPRGSDKDRFFLFSQTAAALRAGINPAEFFSNMAPRVPPRFRGSMSALSAAAAEGTAISAVLAQYPNLYPSSVVGLVRAGEQGGFLPEACDTVAQQAEGAHKFRRWFWWVSFVLINALLAIPGAWLVRVGLLRTWEIAEGQGVINSKQVAGDFLGALWEQLRWPIGPAVLVVWAACSVGWRLFQSDLLQGFRHRLGLAWPVFGPRARHENLTIFSWTLGKLTASGLPYNTAWGLAADAVPNLQARQQLVSLGARATAEQRVSDLIQSSKLFPREFAPIVSTAEYVGNVPGALDQLARASRAEFQSTETIARLRGGCWGMLALIVSSFAALAIVLWAWYRELLPRMADPGLNEPGYSQPATQSPSLPPVNRPQAPVRQAPTGADPDPESIAGPAPNP